MTKMKLGGLNTTLTEYTPNGTKSLMFSPKYSLLQIQHKVGQGRQTTIEVHKQCPLVAEIEQWKLSYLNSTRA